MINIAFVTPWPPQHTGIADYAFDLVWDLSKLDIRIHVYTDCENPQMLNNVKIFQIKDRNLSKLRSYDLIIYQMGNNVDFHLYMLDLVKEYGGIVHLHDMVLHHIMGWVTWMQGDVASYLGLLRKWYGEDISLMCEELLRHEIMPWEWGIVTDLPLFEELIQYADACIVHSQFAKKRVKMAFPDLNVYRITHILKGMEIVEKHYDSDKKKIKIGILGGIEPNKNVDVIMEALSNFKGDRSFWEVHIAGGVGEMCQNIPGLPAKLGIGSNVLFHGRLDDKRFKNLLSEMDLLISLRYPTMGETSGVVTRAVQMGIPVVVNDIGWYSELPDFTDKLSVGNMHDELLRVLRRYVFEPDYVKEKKKKFVENARSELNAERIIKIYLGILATEYRKKCNQKPIETISDLFNDLNIDNVPTMERAVRRLQIIFDK